MLILLPLIYYFHCSLSINIFDQLTVAIFRHFRRSIIFDAVSCTVLPLLKQHAVARHDATPMPAQNGEACAAKIVQIFTPTFIPARSKPRLPAARADVPPKRREAHRLPPFTFRDQPVMPADAAVRRHCRHFFHASRSTPPLMSPVSIIADAMTLLSPRLAAPPPLFSLTRHFLRFFAFSFFRYWLPEDFSFLR